MLSFYSMLARKPWGRPENTKGTMGTAPEVQGPATLHSYRTGRTTEAFCFRAENISATARVLRIPRNRGTHRFYMFSFLDARKAHNQLRWIGKTRKMAGTSGNSVSGSYRVHCCAQRRVARGDVTHDVLHVTWASGVCVR